MAPADEARASGQPGLRERKKKQTRVALSQAAIRLCVLHGWADVTIERIAAEAGVSVRTFRNYFSGKAEAIAAGHVERMLRVADDLLARPVGEPLWDSLRHAVLSQFATSDNSAPQDQRWREGVRLMLAEPALAGQIVKANAAAQEGLAKAVAQRTGTDAEHDVYPKLVAAVVAAGSAVAVEHALRADASAPLGAILARVFEQIAAGLPVP
ncbi:acyl-CoA-like ligand-binding transcription factor [Streptantibioticus cattleyicolor]|uniref:TetR family transcriptional regulator n=1 Tax=Streptantibioticus cattleyicolor (strain ATCC 35852 / DSM 46488 / JCM 4925 / NBRC 14057 / NRRL 8057) TaxID=1003195 RepID=F8JKF0_STREN|nr:TetR family transcriptional regulator [Streptantibioticus cattleyicolor]AEW99782.1 TetR family transcriptional regulator [Streptantibioticus cattleyicolor NRRL 8057 = DSM 46488]CCB71179.1 TetR-family transcriptional regulator [Streptantibioticus cattleyicolor NRRL 8057 = DSM 46488]